MNKTPIISLGSSCDGANQLKRIGINNIHYFFDFIWNEYDGLKTVTKIIDTDFKYFDDIKNYTKTTNHPVLKPKSFNINKYYPNFVFMHHNTKEISVIESFNRKILRTKDILKSNNKKVFIYYRHYHWNFNLCNDLNVLINESLEFCEMYKKKYNDNFQLISLIVYNPNINIKKINKELSILKDNENENLKFDFLFRRNDKNKKLNIFFRKSWDRIFRNYKLNV